MNNKRAKHFDKKIILIATVVLVVLAFQMESLSRRRVREQFRCALRRIRRGGNPAATTTATTTAVPGTSTTAVLTSTVPPPLIRVSQACNTGEIATDAEAELYQGVYSKIH